MTPNEPPTTPSASPIDFAPLGYHGAPTSPSAGRTVDIVKFTVANWKRLGAGFLAGLLLGTLFYLWAGPRYVGSTRLLVTRPPNTSLQEGTVSTYGDTGGHVHLIKSNAIIGPAFLQHNLGQLDTLNGSDDPIKDIIDSLEVKRSAGQDRSFQSIIDISYSSPSKEDAGLVTTALVDAYDQYLTKTRQENTEEVLNVFSRANVGLQKEIGDLEEEYQKFRNDAPILFNNAVGLPTTGGAIITPPNHYLQEVTRVRTNLSANRNARTDIRAQIEVLDEMLTDGESREAIEHYIMLALSRPSPTAGASATGTGGGGGGGGGGAEALFADRPAKDRLDTELLKQMVEKAKLNHHIGSDHPAAAKNSRAIDVVIDAYQALGLVPPKFSDNPATDGDSSRSDIDVASVYRTFLKTQLKQLNFSEEVLKDELTEAISEAKKASIYEVRDKQLADDLERKKDIYSELVNKLKKLDITKEQTGFRMQPISDILVEMSLKRIIKIVGAFGILGALSVFGLLYFMEWQDLTMKSLDEVRRYTESTVMGVVPHFRVDPRKRADDGSGLSEALCYYHKPGSREAEAFRSVRTTLFFSTASHNDRIIQISSPEPNDGKTTSVANLAVAVAQSGKRVLLIDGDLRRPTIHELFGVPQHVGVADVLRREIEWINAVRPTAIDGLFIMTAGDTPENPAELLSTSDLANMLKAARNEFDYIFIDTPPILAVSDPCIISPHTDGLLLVVRMHKNKRPAVVRTRDILDSHGVHLYGVIANDLEGGPGEEGQYHDYSAYYNTGRSPSTEGPVTREPVVASEDS